MTELTDEQKAAIDAMVHRRVGNTGETPEQARVQIAAFFEECARELEAEKRSKRP
jgi:hypothetical protein